MKHLLRLTLLLAALAIAWPCSATETENPEAVTNLLTRVTNAADRFETVLDDALAASNGADVFVITAKNGKPCIKGSSLSAITTGINWYLNHYAHVNIAWNNLTVDLSAVSLPVPTTEETHTASVDYRYYLNYCTFSYSMSIWTWERWQQEIDWMALHGINMPLQIVGLDVVWKNLLTEDLGYTSDEANEFIAGPCFQAWWGMNNLEGWGGKNPDWWYTRQEALATKILARERELGMQPVLPGYAGMVPSDIATKKGYTANNQGNWCYFTRPYILDPNSNAFAEVSEKYYARLKEVMGTSEYYSMDPFHEGANTDGIDVASAYSKIAEAMMAANASSRWVIQFWQWSSDQYNVLSKVSKGKLIVLDLFSDAHTHFGEYNGHDAVYCMLPNFGGRTGLFGRLSKVMTDFYTQKSSYSNVKGIGATPEAIEQVPVLYDALFELPWRSTQPDPQEWLADYATNRYGASNTNAQEAWEKLRNSALNCESSLQGPHEAVVCARPSLSVGSVSSWGGTDIFYDAQDVADAAAKLLAAKGDLSGDNYSYDLTDVTRQALTDYAYYLLKGINTAHTAKDETSYATRRDAYLQLILDLDELLSTNKNFMLGRWTQMARAIADEATGTTSSDKDWLELNNARTLITTWGDYYPSEYGGLRDYSYREWGGMLKDFYYPRWQKFFDNLDNGTSLPSWFDNDWAWAHNTSKTYSYSDEPTGSTAEVASTLFSKYFVDFTVSTSSTYHVYRHLETDARSAVALTAYRGQSFSVPVSTLPDGVTATTSVDFNNDGQITTDEQADGTSIDIPTTAVSGRVTARLSLSDGTTFTFYLTLKDEITEARTVTVQTADATQGTVAISGTTELSVTNTDEVTMTATPAAGYDFAGWTDAEGNTVSTDNTYTYYGAAAATFTATFIVNKWGTPTEDLSELSTIDSYGQYLGSITVSQNGGEEQSIYSASSCPSTLCQTTSSVKAPQGSKFNIHWTDMGGMNYCRLSAYIDLNSDGDFDDDDELLAVVGDKESSGNTALNDYTLSVLLPYDVPEGLTHLRLRFDGAWQTGQDATTGAMPAKATTKRMVYDVPVLVTTESATACTVTVQTSNTKHGTVDANGQPETYTYGAGEEVVLRCYPADDYAIDYWTDSYGRHVPTSWMDGNFLRFKAPESNTYTAYFKSAKTLTVDGWTLLYDDADGINVTEVVSGSGSLDLSAENSVGKDITSIDPNTFRGNTALTALTLPASLTSFDTALETSLTGSGTSNALITPATTIAATTPWSLSLSATNDGSTYNDWGSGLLATGTDALANSYDGGFQLYLAAAGTLTVKVGSTEYGFSTALGSSFNIAMSYDGSGTLTVTVTNASGTTETKTISTTLSAISSFASSIPTGVNITSLRIDDPYLSSYPLSGCTALTDINVADGNKLFSSTDGLLYNADGTRLLAYPEGRLTRRAFTLSTVATTPRVLYSAPTASTDGTTFTTGATLNARTIAASSVSLPTALVTLAPNADGTYTLRHLNSGRSLTVTSDAANKVLQVPSTADTEGLALTYALTISDNAPTLTFTSPSGLYVGVSGYNTALRTAAASWTLAEANAIPLTLDEQGWAATCLPVPIVVPTDDVATLYKATAVNGTTLKLTALEAETVVAAGEPLLVTATSNPTLSISTDTAAATSTDNILSGTTVARTGFTENSLFTLGANNDVAVLLLTSATSVNANTAYLPQSVCPEVSASFLTFDTNTETGITSPVTLDGEPAAPLYDLSGRRVKRADRGGVYLQEGHKFIAK